jgi:hypothetical protein
MKITTRISSSGFIEIKVDEVETIIFKDSKQEILDIIENLLDVVENIEKLNK